MTFQRIQALANIINRYKSYLLSYECKYHDDRVAVIISIELLQQLRAKCVYKMWLTQDGEEYFMGCQITKSLADNYLAVAYLNELDGTFHDLVEITDEEA